MDDDISVRINHLVDEEHHLRGRAGGVSDEERDRLAALEVQLDQCWDLLRRRRARRRAGEDPDEVEVLMALAIFSAMLFGIGWPLLGPLGARAEASEHVTWATSEQELAPGSSSVDGPTLAT